MGRWNIVFLVRAVLLRRLDRRDRRWAVSHFCEHGNDLVIIEVGHGVLKRTVSFSKTGFGNLSAWLPSSVAFIGARVVANVSMTKVTNECSLYRPGQPRSQGLSPLPPLSLRKRPSLRLVT